MGILVHGTSTSPVIGFMISICRVVKGVGVLGPGLNVELENFWPWMYEIGASTIKEPFWSLR